MQQKISAYEAPAVILLGKVEELTLVEPCNKKSGGSDGFTFQNAPIICST
jgi:hypothetical protein